jgi:hypothetical protein
MSLIAFVIGLFIAITLLPVLAYGLLFLCCYAAYVFVLICDFIVSLNPKNQFHKSRV